MNDDVALGELSDVVRRSLQSRTSDQHLIEDVTQEVIVRVTSMHLDLPPDELRAYAVVTARNVLIGHARREDVARRHAHLVGDPHSVDGAEELTLATEETDALAAALDQLDADDRQLLVDHQVHDVSVAELALRHRTSSGAMAMRLARARAVLRVEFVLRFRRVWLPTDRCRAVLLAISAGDHRRLALIGAPEHLELCATCAGLAAPLKERRRGAAAWWALPVPAWLRAAWSKLRRSHLTQAVAAAVVTAAVAVTAVVLSTVDSGAEAHTAAATSTASNASGAALTAPVVPVIAVPSGARAPATSPSSLDVSPIAPVCPPDAPPLTADDAGCTVTLTSVTVSAVPADEGFWITYLDGAPLWVHLVGNGESPQHIVPGATLTLHGVVTPVGTPADSGIPADKAGELAHRDVYLTVEFADVAVDTTPPTT